MSTIPLSDISLATYLTHASILVCGTQPNESESCNVCLFFMRELEIVHLERCKQLKCLSFFSNIICLVTKATRVDAVDTDNRFMK